MSVDDNFGNGPVRRVQNTSSWVRGKSTMKTGEKAPVWGSSPTLQDFVASGSLMGAGSESIISPRAQPTGKDIMRAREGGGGMGVPIAGKAIEEERGRIIYFGQQPSSVSTLPNCADAKNKAIWGRGVVVPVNSRSSSAEVLKPIVRPGAGRGAGSAVVNETEAVHDARKIGTKKESKPEQNAIEKSKNGGTCSPTLAKRVIEPFAKGFGDDRKKSAPVKAQIDKLNFNEKREFQGYEADDAEDDNDNDAAEGERVLSQGAIIEPKGEAEGKKETRGAPGDRKSLQKVLSFSKLEKSNTSASLLGQTVDGYVLVKKIGFGGFGEIYEGRKLETNDKVALKFERADLSRKVLNIETAIVKKLTAMREKYIVGYQSHGTGFGMSYLSMNLLGDNMADIKKKTKGGRFTLKTTAQLGMMMLKGLKAVHKIGFLHRDIKPSNFAMGLGTQAKICYLIDFGLAKRFSSDDGKILAARENVGFRGTARYASIYCHMNQDQGRRDDMWSWFYVLLEFALGSLPWKTLKDKDSIGHMKRQLHNLDLVSALPFQFSLIMKHLMGLGFEDGPDYLFLYNTIKSIFVESGGKLVGELDWMAPSLSHCVNKAVPSLKSICMSKLVFNMGRTLTFVYNKKCQLPPEMQLELIDLAKKIKGGKFAMNLLDGILDKDQAEINLDGIPLEGEEEGHNISEKFQKLKVLTFGEQQVSENAVKVIITTNSTSLQQVTFLNGKHMTLKLYQSMMEMCANLKKLHFHWCEKINDKVVISILKSCLWVEDISLLGCRKIKGKFLAAKSSPPSKGKKVSYLKNLNLSYCDISMKGWKLLCTMANTLQELSIDPLFSSEITSRDLIAFLETCKDLKGLDISPGNMLEVSMVISTIADYCNSLRKLNIGGEVDDFSVSVLASILGSLQSLKLKLGENCGDSGILKIIFSTSHHMKSLKLTFSPSMSLGSSISRLDEGKGNDKGVRQIFQFIHTNPNFSQLKLEGCRMLYPTSFPENLQIPQLKKLDLSSCPHLDDHLLIRISHSCPNLEKFKLDKTSGRLTDITLEALMKFNAQLRTLSLKGCTWFSDVKIKQLLVSIPLIFIWLTRYPDARGVDRRVHQGNVTEVLCEGQGTPPVI